MAGEAVFLDTSLLAAASIKVHPGHEAARAALAVLKSERAEACISPQVCAEFLVTLTRQPVAGRIISAEETFALLDEWLLVSGILVEDEAVLRELRRLVQEYRVRGKQIHDCNIVATMLTYGVKRLVTRNAADFERYDEEIEVVSVAP